MFADRLLVKSADDDSVERVTRSDFSPRVNSRPLTSTRSSKHTPNRRSHNGRARGESWVDGDGVLDGEVNNETLEDDIDNYHDEV